MYFALHSHCSFAFGNELIDPAGISDTDAAPSANYSIVKCSHDHGLLEYIQNLGAYIERSELLQKMEFAHPLLVHSIQSVVQIDTHLYSAQQFQSPHLCCLWAWSQLNICADRRGVLTWEVWFMEHASPNTFECCLNGFRFGLATLVVVACSFGPVEQSTWKYPVNDSPKRWSVSEEEGCYTSTLIVKPAHDWHEYVFSKNKELLSITYQYHHETSCFVSHYLIVMA